MTFSITARCERTGKFGIAISTKVIAVGARCIYAKAKLGAISSQAFSNPYIGIDGLEYLRKGLSASETLEKVLSDDPSPDVRQVSIIDHWGNVAVHTGSNCIEWKGHRTGKDYSVAGNMLVNKETIDETARTFEECEELELPNRLLKALEAGQRAGGDKRGKQSAALFIVDEEEYPLLDLRVDEHKNPVEELRRIYNLAEHELLPRMKSLPTRQNPAGNNDLSYAKKIGLIDKN